MNSNFFNKEKQAKAIKWLEEKWLKTHRKCEVCGHDQWALGDDLITPLAFSPNSIDIGNKNYPNVLLMCNNCGNSKFFNAVIMKILGD